MVAGDCGLEEKLTMKENKRTSWGGDRNILYLDGGDLTKLVQLNA